nr:MAG: replication initiator protein [Microvirus sp.]
MSCLRPIQIRDKQGLLQTVACDKCPNCYFRKTAGWTFRLMAEEKHSSSSHFITMTYDTDHLVTTPFGKPSLCKYDLQNFFKRLRKLDSSARIKYYAVGEYGSQTARPHYHAILFNADIELIEKAWTLDGLLIGDIYYGDVCEASIGYTLKYLNKKSTAGLIGDDDRHPQFTLSSNKLGMSYLTPAMRAWHLADLHNRKYVTLKGGIKAAMPRYYQEKIYDGYSRDLLKMSGSLIQQDEFFIQFMSKSYEKRMEENLLFEKRVEAAFARHEYNHSKIMML